MTVKPLAERVLVKVEMAEKKTASGLLHIPDSAQEKTQIGLVVAVGSGKEICVKPGDRVMHDKYAGSAIKIDGVDHLLLKTEDLIATVE